MSKLQSRFRSFLSLAILLFALGFALIMQSCTSYRKEKNEKVETHIPSPVSESKYPQEKVTTAPNKIYVKANIANIEKSDWPNVKLTLIIEEVTKTEGVDFLRSQKSLETHPQFATDYDGSILQTSPENQTLLKAYDLSIGDRISAKLTYRGDEHDGRWYLISFQKTK
jgi:hypothetical protein